MASYYIDPTWAGPFVGTEAQPFAAYSSVPSLVANDFVYFKRGTIHVGQVLYDSSRGASTTLATPITFGAYGSGALPVIKSNSYVVDVVARNGVVVQDLRCEPVNSFSSGAVRALDSEQITVQRVTVGNRCDYGIRIDSTLSTLLSKINVLNNTIEGTYGNTGILIIWGTAEGGVFEDVIITGNYVTATGYWYNTDTSNTPYGIRCLSRTTPLTTSSGTVDRNLFSRGVRIMHNTVISTPSYGISYSCVSSGGTATIRNDVSNNTLTDIGNGNYDSHMLWTAACRDVWVEDNKLNGSIMLRGAAFGTGVGIFVDTFGFVNLFDGSKRIYIRRNKVRRTGRLAAESLGDYEVAGAGILVFLSNTVEITDNEVRDCNNGIGVLGWFGTGLVSSAVTITGNKCFNIANFGITTIKAAASVTCKENYVDGYGNTGIYAETGGAYAVTGYTETRNGVSGNVLTAYREGSFPTASEATIVTRTPSAGNLVLAERVY